MTSSWWTYKVESHGHEMLQKVLGISGSTLGDDGMCLNCITVTLREGEKEKESRREVKGEKEDRGDKKVRDSIKHVFITALF